MRSLRKDGIAKSLVSLVALVGLGCSTAKTVDREYHAELRDKPQLVKGPLTTIVILVDGLSADLLNQTIAAGRAQSLREFFQLQGDGRAPVIPLARASFPTLTFPNLTSILTASTVGEHGILGNRVRDKDGSVVDFEDVQNWSTLYHRTRALTVFAQLTKTKQTAVNFSYPFSDTGGTTVDQAASAASAVDYLLRDYAAIDHETVSSLEDLLSKTKPAGWPRFIFVHFIGVDALAHEFGPKDDRVSLYLDDLTRLMGRVLSTIEATEKAGRAVATVLTADHGFVEINNEVPLEAEVRKLSPEARVISDNRTAPIYLPSQWTPAQTHELADHLRSLPHVAWVLEKDGNSGINLLNPEGLQARIEYAPGKCQDANWEASVQWGKAPPPSGRQCLEKFDLTASPSNQDFMVPAAVEYFTAPTSPSLLLVADDNSEFSGNYQGNHGGLTSGEVLVPILSRNAGLPTAVFPTARLLRELGLLPLRIQ